MLSHQVAFCHLLLHITQVESLERVHIISNFPSLQKTGPEFSLNISWVVSIWSERDTKNIILQLGGSGIQMTWLWPSIELRSASKFLFIAMIPSISIYYLFYLYIFHYDWSSWFSRYIMKPQGQEKQQPC